MKAHFIRTKCATERPLILPQIVQPSTVHNVIKRFDLVERLFSHWMCVSKSIGSATFIETAAQKRRSLDASPICHRSEIQSAFDVYLDNFKSANRLIRIRLNLADYYWPIGTSLFACWPCLFPCRAAHTCLFLTNAPANKPMPRTNFIFLRAIFFIKCQLLHHIHFADCRLPTHHNRIEIHRINASWRTVAQFGKWKASNVLLFKYN